MVHMPADGRRRVVIENVRPAVDHGLFPAKRSIGDRVRVEAAVFADGHDQLNARVRYRHESDGAWSETPMEPAGNDLWRAAFTVDRMGCWHFTVAGWVDHARSWRHDLERRIQPEDIAVALQVGAELVAEAGHRAAGTDAERLRQLAERLGGDGPLDERLALGLADELKDLLEKYPDRRLEVLVEPERAITVERERARFSSWYEFFPRSCPDGDRPSLEACAARLEYVASMGFDVVYLPPIHPIGQTRRKGPNNTLTAGPNDPGSPWAIGATEGGHTAVHPELGDAEALRAFIARATENGLEVALDIAFQCSPDHPWVHEHPEWFRHRPDGSVQFAENPPKRYEDIYPFDFETDAWQGLWEALRDVVRHWIDAGVRIFRVDNPHTKPFPFWQWLIADIHHDDPDIIFLAEAFARPHIMYRLAKVGFTQSYTYFTWRNTREELERYMTELTRTGVRDFFRPNFWPNTPDILPEYLQFGGRPAFMSRLVLAATLSPNYGIYGPAFELMENTPREPGSEEYLDSEKYQRRDWPVERADSLQPFITRINTIRRSSPALQQVEGLTFHAVDNEQLIAYSRHSEWPDEDLLLVVVNLDPHHRQSGWISLPLERFGIALHQPFQMHDLITGSRFLWNGEHNYVELDPQRSPAHLFRVHRRTRTERDFEYFF